MRKDEDGAVVRKANHPRDTGVESASASGAVFGKGVFTTTAASHDVNNKQEGGPVRTRFLDIPSAAGLVRAAMDEEEDAKNCGGISSSIIPPAMTITISDEPEGDTEGPDWSAAASARDVSNGTPHSPVTSIDDSDRGVSDRRHTFSGVGADGCGMRQESLYLRGVVEEERDQDLLSTIKECIRGEIVSRSCHVCL